MDLFKLTVGRTGGDAPHPLVAFEFGGAGQSLAKLDIGDVREVGPSRTVSIGLGSLLTGTAGVFAANAVAGWLSGSIGSTADILVNHLDAMSSAGAKGTFAAYFVAHAVGAEIAKRILLRKDAKFREAALSWKSIDAATDKDGQWVVGPASTIEGSPLDCSPNAWNLWARNKITVMGQADFARFEALVAERGGVLRKYRADTDGNALVVTTELGGKLHSVDGEPAWKLLVNGTSVKQEWYRNGLRIPMPADSRVLSGEDEAVFKFEGPGFERRVIEAATVLMRQASDKILPCGMQEERRSFVEGRAILARADAMVKAAFGDGFAPLDHDLENFDALIGWPVATADVFSETAKRHLLQSMESLDAALVAVEAPDLAALADAVEKKLLEEGRDEFRVRLRGGSAHVAYPMLSVTRDDDAEPIHRIAWREDAWFGKPGFGEVSGSSISWKPSMTVDDVFDSVLSSRSALDA